MVGEFNLRLHNLSGHQAHRADRLDQNHTVTTVIFKEALKGQYHAALAMLRIPIEQCPEELWDQGVNPRRFWRLAYHTLFFTHLYLCQTEADYEPDALDEHAIENAEPDAVLAPLSKSTMLDYWQRVDDLVDAKVDLLDLDSPESGFPWYKSFPKLDHQLLNLRHIQEHAGQLRDRLMEAGIDQDWISRGRQG